MIVSVAVYCDNASGCCGSEPERKDKIRKELLSPACLP